MSKTVRLEVDTGLYPREAVFGAAYVFIDRCYVLLDAPRENVLTVSLRGRGALDDDALEALRGEFGNELLAQALRRMITDHNRPLIETVVGRVLTGAAGPSSSVANGGGEEPEFDLSELEALELEDEPFEDPLGIAVSWEEKYGKERAEKKAAKVEKAEKAPAETASDA